VAYVAAFEVGACYLDVGLFANAREHLGKALELIPEKPPAWA
jgi:Flp pilus assembly protein TadD